MSTESTTVVDPLDAPEVVREGAGISLLEPVPGAGRGELTVDRPCQDLGVGGRAGRARNSG